MIAQLSEIKPDQSKKIHDEILALSAELSTIANHTSTEHGVVLEPGSSPCQASHISTNNKLYLLQQRLGQHPPAKEPSNCTHRKNGLALFLSSEQPESALSSQSTPPQSSSRQSTPPQSTPPQSTPPQSTPPQSTPPQSTPPQSTPTHPGLFIRHEMQDGVICLVPTMEQWLDFPSILRYAQGLGAEEIGICKVVLPEDLIGQSKPARYTRQKASCYDSRPQSNGTFILERKDCEADPKGRPEPVDISSDTIAVQHFEELLTATSGLKHVLYCIDVDAQTPEERQSLGLPKSPVWPLQGDRLSETRIQIPGIHWPYAYEAYDSFGAPFAMHREDGDLHSINYLYEGAKYWIVVPETHATMLEEEVRQRSGHSLHDCAQFLRHTATYFPVSILEEWQIPYKVVHQKAGEVMITFPRVYHQGFSAGYTFAEAVNYADQDWSIEGYQECDSQYCPSECVRKEMLEFRVDGEERRLERNGDDDRNNDGLVEGRTTRARKVGTKQGIWSSNERLQGNTTINKTRASSRGIKRKPVSQEMPNKLFKRQQLFIDDASALLKGLVPKNLIQPTGLHQTLASRSRSEDPSSMEVLTRLFYAIGSPDAFYQLHHACKASRQVQELRTPQLTNSISEAMQALDQLDVTVIAPSILRRFYLATLVTHRHDRERHHQSQRPERRIRSRNSPAEERFKRADTAALADMMAEAYPNLKPTRKRSAALHDEYQKKLSSLKIRLREGRNWYMMQQRFSSGILALVPTYGEYQIQNYKLVVLSQYSLLGF